MPIDLAKRNALIESLHTRSRRHDPKGVLSEADKRAIASAYAEDKPVPAARTDVAAQPPASSQEHADGEIVLDIGPLMDWAERFLPERTINIAPLLFFPDAFAGQSAAANFERLIRTTRKNDAGPIFTVDVHSFYDGNGDRMSVAPNVVDSASGPTFEMIRDTILSIAGYPQVLAMGFEIGDCPNPDHPGDNDCWLQAERLFIWSTEPPKVVRTWLRSLHPDGVGRIAVRNVIPPREMIIPRRTKVSSVAWD